MSSSIGIIGGADGPTAIYITGSPHWFSVYGLIMLILLMLPNILYAIKHREPQPERCGRTLLLLEQVGRYGCMLLTVFRLPVLLGLQQTVGNLWGCFHGLIACTVLLALYWVYWVLYNKKATRSRALVLAILPSMIFLLAGIARPDWFLTAFALLFSVCHITITAKNTKRD